jgi:hypothetical protein
MTPTRPPRLALFLLAHVLPDDDPLTGDLVEEFAAGRGVAWFWRQTLAAVAAAWRRPSAGVRPLRLVSHPSALGVDPTSPWPRPSGGPFAYLAGDFDSSVGGLGLLAVLAILPGAVPLIGVFTIAALASGALLGVLLIRHSAHRVDREWLRVNHTVLIDNHTGVARR